MKTDLDLRPVCQKSDAGTLAHLHLALLAYWIVNTVRCKLKANDTGIEITVSHYPPGTSKWNKIDYRLFSYISMNWKSKPLLNVQLVVDLIASTTTTKGLKVK